MRGRKTKRLGKPDTVLEYVRRLRPSSQLKYYWLTKGERLTLDAMLNCTEGTGENVFAGMQKLAELAGLAEKTVRNAINGYKRKDGSQHRGLRARGILLQTKPPNRGERRSASYRINFQAFTIHPRQVAALERRVFQPGLPGMDPHSGPQPSTRFPPKTPATDAAQGGSSCHPERKQMPGRAATDAAIVVDLVVGSSSEVSIHSRSNDGEKLCGEEIRETISRSFQSVNGPLTPLQKPPPDIPHKIPKPCKPATSAATQKAAVKGAT